MGEVDISALKIAFESATGFAEWATIAVTAGVFIELVALFIFSKEMPPAEKAVMVFATMLIVAGCAGEYIFGNRASTAAVKLQEASDTTVAGLKARALLTEKDIVIAKNNATITEERLLTERRLTARERMRLERLESIVLPRSIHDPSGLSAALKTAGINPINLAIVDDREANSFGLAFMIVLKGAGLLAGVTWLPATSSAPSLLVVGSDDEVDRLADLLFQKFQIGQGWRQKIPVGEEPDKSNGSLKGVPAGRDCLIIGSNRDAAFQGAPGQPGEGIDRHGGPDPAPH